jgi:hypothetical protein
MADKLAVKIYKMRKIKLAHLKKIKKFIFISNKHLRIVDKIALSCKKFEFLWAKCLS